MLGSSGLIDAVTDLAIPQEAADWHFAGLPVALDTRPWRIRYPDGLLITQERLEEILEDHLAGFGVKVRRSTELTGLDADNEGVTATVRGPDGQYRLRGRYLAACDGGHSTVRKLTGVAFPGRAGTLAAVSADIELTARSATVPRSVDHISRLTRTGGGYWMLLHPLDGPDERTGRCRVVFGGSEQATPPRTAPVTADEVARALTAVHGMQTRLGRLRWGTRFSDAARQVTDYRIGPVVFVGDAAHIYPPMDVLLVRMDLAPTSDIHSFEEFTREAIHAQSPTPLAHRGGRRRGHFDRRRDARRGGPPPTATGPRLIMAMEWVPTPEL